MQNQKISDADATNAPALATTGEVSIRTRDLDLFYGDFQALFGVSVDIKPGIITDIAGILCVAITVFLQVRGRSTMAPGPAAP